MAREGAPLIRDLTWPALDVEHDLLALDGNSRPRASRRFRPSETPCLERSKLASRARMPPIGTVISGAVSVNKLALSSSSVSGDNGCPGRKFATIVVPDALLAPD